MKLTEHLRDLTGNRYTAIVLGTAGIILVLLSALVPEKGTDKAIVIDDHQIQHDAEAYCRETEQRLEEFLGQIEGAGKVSVFIRVSDSGMNVYAQEGRTSESGDRKEVDEKYVMVSDSGGRRNALLETIREPGITGVVVLCTGGSSPAVQERIYNALGALLGLPAGRIYVTKSE